MTDPVIRIPAVLVDHWDFRLTSKPKQDNMAVFCFALSETSCSSINTKRKDRNWISISYNFLEKYIHRNNISRTRTMLINIGIIETDGSWLCGKKSIGYRFTDLVQIGSFVDYKLQTKAAKNKVYEERGSECQIV